MIARSGSHGSAYIDGSGVRIRNGRPVPPRAHTPRDRLLAALPPTWQRRKTVTDRAGLHDEREARRAFRVLAEQGHAEASPDGSAWRRKGRT